MATASPFSEQATSNLSNDIGTAGKFAIQPLNTLEKMAKIGMDKDKADAAAAAAKNKELNKVLGDPIKAPIVKREKENEEANQRMTDFSSQLQAATQEGNINEIRRIQQEAEIYKTTTQNNSNINNDLYAKKIDAINSNPNPYYKKQLAKEVTGKNYYDGNVEETTFGNVQSGVFMDMSKLTRGFVDKRKASAASSISNGTIERGGIEFYQATKTANEATFFSSEGNPVSSAEEFKNEDVDLYLASDDAKNGATYQVLSNPDYKYKEWLVENLDSFYEEGSEQRNHIDTQVRLEASGVEGVDSWVAATMMDEGVLTAFNDDNQEVLGKSIGELVDDQARDNLLGIQHQKQTLSRQKTGDNKVGGGVSKSFKGVQKEYIQFLNRPVNSTMVSPNGKRRWVKTEDGYSVQQLFQEGDSYMDFGTLVTHRGKDPVWAEVSSEEAAFDDEKWKSGQHTENIRAMGGLKDYKNISTQKVGENLDDDNLQKVVEFKKPSSIAEREEVSVALNRMIPKWGKLTDAVKEEIMSELPPLDATAKEYQEFVTKRRSVLGNPSFWNRPWEEVKKDLPNQPPKAKESPATFTIGKEEYTTEELKGAGWTDEQISQINK